MPANHDDPCVLYYISDATCTDPYQHGYIGITKNEKLRERAHRRLGKFPGGFTFVVLHRGSRKECAEVEKRYRPTEDIGWNTSKGGGRWRGLSNTDNPQENANMKRFDVPVRCIEPAGIEPVTVTVFSGSKQGAREAATEKMKDKYLRHQNLETKWVVAGEPVEG